MNPNDSILHLELEECLRFEESLADTQQAVLGRVDSVRENVTESAVSVLRQFAMAWFLVSRRSRVRLGTLLLTFAALGASAATPKRVLILDSFGRDVAPFSIGVSAFRTTLARELDQPVDIYEVPLDMARFPNPGFEKPLADFLEQRFAGSPVDLVVPVGAPAVSFAAQHRERLFAETPILFMGADPRRVPPDALKTDATLVTVRADQIGRASCRERV